MASYQQMVEAFLTKHQPEMKVELAGRGELQAYLDEQSEAMFEIKGRLLAQLQQRSPGLSPLQAGMEAERTMLELFLTP